MKLFPTFWLLQGIIGLNLLSSYPVIAQIVPDGTLPENSIVTPQGNTLQIDGGTKAGNNLFHSFKEFSVPTNNTAAFNNALEIQNIFSRVTGSSISNINGIIKANGTANLFLINPNGIVFGPNAALNIGGSFVASTANRIIFSDGFEFSATNPQATPLLTINVPIGLGFGASPGEIINQSRATVSNFLIGRSTDPKIPSDPTVAGLQVKDGKTLALIGGNVVLDGGNLTANSGRIEIGSVAGNNIVSLTPIERGWQFGYEGVQAFQDISFFPRTIIDTSGNVGGDIQLQGKQITLTGNQMESPVLVFSNIVGGGQAGSIVANASEMIKISGDFSKLQTQSDGKGTAGSIFVNTEKLILSEGGQITSLASEIDKGKAGDISIISKHIEMSDIISKRISPTAIATEASLGDGGAISIQTENLFLINGAQIATPTNTQFLIEEGKGGNLSIDASNIEVTGGFNNKFSTINTQSQSNGNAGNLTINTQRLKVLDGGFISASTFINGQGGQLTINATESILISNNGALFVLANQNSSGNAGNISLTTKQLIVETLGNISSETVGTGDAGNITLNVGQLIIRDEGRIQAASSLQNELVIIPEGGGDISAIERGKGGIITINATDSVNITDGLISTQAKGTGDAGSIFLNTDGQLIVGQGGIISANTFSTGNAGNIVLNVGQLLVQDGGEISSGSLLIKNDSGQIVGGQGAGGTISINATESVNVNGSSRLFTLAEGTGDAGNISINTSNLNLTDGAEINATTKNIGQAGDIDVTAANLSVGKNARISVETTGAGNAGNITLNTGQLAILDGGQILANTTKIGQGGTITINATDINIIDGSISTQAQGTGDAGNITFDTDGQVIVGQEAEITANTFSTGNAGNIILNVGQLQIQNGGEISSGSLLGEDTSTLEPSTLERGAGGTITINATDSVEVTGTSIDDATFPSRILTLAESTGDAGNIFINTNNLSVTDGAQITASTLVLGEAGTISVQASTFSVSQGGQLLTTTFGTQDAGDIAVQTENFTLNGLGSGLFANTEEGSSGAGGDINVNSRTTNIQDGATISVNSRGTGVGGDITLQGSSLTLNERASLLAETSSNQGGNITLTLNDLLLLRNQSNISATAGLAGGAGDGGNITITAPFILAVPQENSDITANAFAGRGGNVNINTQGIFGIQFREELTPLSDITASSQFGIQGTVTIINPNDDVTERLVEFPETPVDTASLIAQNVCTVEEANRSSLVITGRGGLPPNPSDPPTQDSIVDWATRSQQQNKPPVILKERSQNERPAIQQVQGWRVEADGTIMLTANAATVTPESPIFNAPGCHSK